MPVFKFRSIEEMKRWRPPGDPERGRPEQGRMGSEGRAMPSAKEELTNLIQEQPDDSSREEIIRELAFHLMVERGLADSDAKRTISNQEMAQRIRSWQA